MFVLLGSNLVFLKKKGGRWEFCGCNHCDPCPISTEKSNQKNRLVTIPFDHGLAQADDVYIKNETGRKIIQLENLIDIINALVQANDKTGS